MKRRGGVVQPEKYAVRAGEYYLQGTSGWGQRMHANRYDTEYEAEKVASTIRKRGIAMNARVVVV